MIPAYIPGENGGEHPHTKQPSLPPLITLRITATTPPAPGEKAARELIYETNRDVKWICFVNAGKKVGAVSLQSPTIAAFEANAAATLENTAIATAMGGETFHDPAKETYYCQLKCHDPSGDDYYITLTRKSIRVSSYQDDSILDAIEDWARRTYFRAVLCETCISRAVWR